MLTPRQWAARVAASALQDRCRKDPAMRERQRQWSARGGREVYARHGRAHMVRLARLAAEARKRKEVEEAAGRHTTGTLSEGTPGPATSGPGVPRTKEGKP